MKPLSFSQRLKAGWSNADLVKYYTLNEVQYQKGINTNVFSMTDFEGFLECRRV